MDTPDDGGYAAYERLMAALSFAEIPASFPGALLGADVVARQATYLRRWLRANPQKGELLSAPAWRQPRWSSSPASGSTARRPMCARPRSASTRKG